MALREVVYCTECCSSGVDDEEGYLFCEDYCFFFSKESKKDFCFLGSGKSHIEDVILCKDCKYFEEDDDWCKFINDLGGVDGDCFCSNAKPKEKNA